MSRQPFWIQVALVGILIMSNALAGLAEPIDKTLQKAWEAQQNDQTKTTIQLYEEVLATGHYSTELYNNLGLAYAKQGALGKAIVQWERALHWDPQNQEAQHNLKAAQQHISHPITTTAPIALVQGWQHLQQTLSARSWGVIFLLLWVIICGLGGYAWKKGKTNWKSQKEIKWLLSLLLFSLLPLVLGLGQQAHEQTRNIAIVVVKKAGLRPYPELSSKEMEVLSEGIRLQMLEEQGEWVKVELPNYLVGWLPKSLIEQV